MNFIVTICRGQRLAIPLEQADAVQVIALVLEDPSVEVVKNPRLAITHGVRPGGADLPMAFLVPELSWKGQT